MTGKGYILSVLIALFFGVMVSCAPENDIKLSDNTTTLRIMTKADGTDSDADNSIESIRVLVFKPGADLVYNFKTDMNVSGFSNTFDITVTEGVYDFVFIVNEISDNILRTEGGTLTDLLNSYTEGVVQISDLDDLYFNSSAFANDLPIPATVKFTNVTISAKSANKITGTGINATGNQWTVETIRAGIRVDLFIETEHEEMANGFEKLSLLNIPNKVYLFDKNNIIDTDDFETAIREFAKNDGDRKEGTGTNYTLTPANLSFINTKIDNKYYWNKRIILPSSMFADADNRENGILLQALVGQNKYDLILSNETNTDYCTKRNHRYIVNARLTKWDGLVNFQTKVLQWINEPQNVIFDKDYFLKVSKKNISIFGKGNTIEIIAETNYDGGYNNGNQGLSFNNYYNWYEISNPVLESEENGVYRYSIILKIKDSNNYDWGEFWLQAGNMRLGIEVQQFPGDWLSSDVAPYYQSGDLPSVITVTTQWNIRWRILDIIDPDDILLGGDKLIGMIGYSDDYNPGKDQINFYIKPSAQPSKTAEIVLEDLDNDNPPFTIKINTKPSEGS